MTVDQVSSVMKVWFAGRLLFAKEYIESGELIIPFELEANIARKPAYYFVTPEHTAETDKIIAVRDWIKEISKEWN